MTQRLSDATLNTYYDYDSATAPTTYLRRSDLQFYIGQNNNAFLQGLSPAPSANSGQSIYFQSPQGYSNSSTTYANTQGLLNACGYFVEFGSDQPYWPALFNGVGLVQPRYRYRLMQTIQSTEFNGIYVDTEGISAETTPAWISPLNSLALPVADNIIALVIWPREDPTLDSAGTALSTDYTYNSRQGLPVPAVAIQSEQMPPILEVTVIAIDEASATRLQNGSAAPTVIETALKTGASGTGAFKQVTQYAADLAYMENALAGAHINYQVLTTSVTLRESKWSSGQ